MGKILGELMFNILERGKVRKMNLSVMNPGSKT